MAKLFITDIRGKVNDLNGIHFVVIVLFHRGDVMNKIPQQETDKNAETTTRAKLCIGYVTNAPNHSISNICQSMFNQRPTFIHN